MLPTPKTTLEHTLTALYNKLNNKPYQLPTPHTNVDRIISQLVTDYTSGSGGNSGEGGGDEIPTDISLRLNKIEEMLFPSGFVSPKFYKVLLITSEFANQVVTDVSNAIVKNGHSVTVVSEANFLTSQVLSHDLVMLSRFNATNYHVQLKQICFEAKIPIIVGYPQQGAIPIFKTLGLGSTAINYANQMSTQSTVINNAHPITKNLSLNSVFNQSTLSIEFISPQTDLFGIPLLKDSDTTGYGTWVYELNNERPIRMIFSDMIYRNISTDGILLMDRMIRYVKYEDDLLNKY